MKSNQCVEAGLKECHYCEFYDNNKNNINAFYTCQLHYYNELMRHTFSEYSNIQLLKILQHYEKYLPGYHPYLLKSLELCYPHRYDNIINKLMVLI